MIRFFRRLKFVLQIHKSIPFIIDIFRSKDVSLSKKVVAVILFVSYAILPFDLIPDFIVAFGIFDELVVLSFILQYFVKIAPQGIRDKHQVHLNKSKG
jgi:uncharacterized membrane protein YkvA (DUF1232 family)